MKITTVGELKQLLANLDDDFTLDVSLKELVPKEQLEKMSYHYPYNQTECIIKFHDIGHSDKQVCFGIYKKGEE